MDWRMPRLNGVQATARIRHQLPEIQVVVFSSADGAGQAGASAFVARAPPPSRSARPYWPPGASRPCQTTP
jgi:CheY-like chemotaxis protein